MANYFAQFDKQPSTSTPRESDSSNYFAQFDAGYQEPVVADEEPSNYFAQFDARQPEEDEGNTAAEYAAGFATDIAISEGGRLGGAALGTAILPGVGTALG